MSRILIFILVVILLALLIFACDIHRFEAIESETGEMYRRHLPDVQSQRLSRRGEDLQRLRDE